MDTAVKTPEKQPSEEARGPKILRNREVDRAAKELAEAHVLPISPGKNLTFDQMQEYLALFTPAMWSHVLVYLYRVRPKIRRQLRDPNSPNYIDCFGEPFTMEYLIKTHGGGKYQIQAVDTEAKRENNQVFLFKCHFDINEVQYEPILDFAELDLSAKENKTYFEWLQNKGILNSKGEVIPKPGTQQPASNSANLTAKEVLDILGYASKMNADQQAAFRAQYAPGADSLSKSVGEILLEKLKQDDPGRDWDRLLALSKEMNKPDTSTPAILQMIQAQNAMMQAQITNANEQRKIDLEHTRLLLETQRHDQSPRSQFGEFREIISFARELMGTTSGRRNGWDTGLEIAREVVLPGIQTIGNVVSNIMALRSNGAPPAPGQPPARSAAPVGPFDPYRNPGAARQYAQTMNQQPQQPAPGQPPPPPQPQPAPAPAPAATDPEAQLLADLRNYGGLIQNHMNNNTTGFDFADYVVGLLGVGVHAQICAAGEQTLVTVMLRIPEIAMFGEARIRTFVNEFVHYQEYLEQAEAGEEDDQQPPTVEMPRYSKPPERATAGTTESRP